MIDTAISALNKGKNIIIPTETVYGIAADPHNNQAIKNIYTIKKRPSTNPLIIHVTDLAMASNYVELCLLSRKLCKKFWPGPLTIVAPKKNGLILANNFNLANLAIRSPNHSLTQSLISKFGKAIAAPSANYSGKISPTKISHIDEKIIKECACILDGGQALTGIESTIITIKNNDIYILRLGSITNNDLKEFAPTFDVFDAQQSVVINDKSTPLTISTDSPNIPTAPGQLLKHYAPNAELILNATPHKNQDSFLDFAQRFNQNDLPKLTINLSLQGSLSEAAYNLFNALHELDNKKVKKIFVAPIPNEKIGKAINDRLQRAAFKKI